MNFKSDNNVITLQMSLHAFQVFTFTFPIDLRDQQQSFHDHGQS